MSNDRVGKLLEKVAFDLGGSEDSAEILEYLEARLGPLLHCAIQLREMYGGEGQIAHDFDRALATLEGRE